MTLPHAKLEAIARQVCEARRGAGAYDRKGCKRAYWRKRAERLHAKCAAMPPMRTLWSAAGWLV